MIRTTKQTRKRTTILSRIVVGAAVAAAMLPASAFAASADYQAAQLPIAAADASVVEAQDSAATVRTSDSGMVLALQSELQQQAQAIAESQAAAQRANKVLAYDPAAIAAIGTQEETGHTICCPSFSCAYADAVMSGIVHDHDYYTCSCCTWTDWGGGESSDRYVGDDEQLLREAYDQLSAGRPTVIHVTYGSGEHWIALIGYQNVSDPDHLTLDNFIALDPWDGARIVASDRFSLYGDGCEHISDR